VKGISKLSSSKTAKTRFKRTDRAVLVKNIFYAHIEGLIAGSLAR
jgi:hypothetical protein